MQTNQILSFSFHAFGSRNGADLVVMLSRLKVQLSGREFLSLYISAVFKNAFLLEHNTLLSNQDCLYAQYCYRLGSTTHVIIIVWIGLWVTMEHWGRWIGRSVEHLVQGEREYKSFCAKPLKCSHLSPKRTRINCYEGNIRVPQAQHNRAVVRCVFYYVHWLPQDTGRNSTEALTIWVKSYEDSFLHECSHRAIFKNCVAIWSALHVVVMNVLQRICRFYVSTSCFWESGDTLGSTTIFQTWSLILLPVLKNIL